MKTLKIVILILMIAFLTQCILATTVAVHEDQKIKREAIRTFSRSMNKSIDSLNNRRPYYRNRSQQYIDNAYDPYDDQPFVTDSYDYDYE